MTEEEAREIAGRYGRNAHLRELRFGAGGTPVWTFDSDDGVVVVAPHDARRAKVYTKHRGVSFTDRALKSERG